MLPVALAFRGVHTTGSAHRSADHRCTLIAELQPITRVALSATVDLHVAAIFAATTAAVYHRVAAASIMYCRCTVVQRSQPSLTSSASSARDVPMLHRTLF